MILFFLKHVKVVAVLCLIVAALMIACTQVESVDGHSSAQSSKWSILIPEVDFGVLAENGWHWDCGTIAEGSPIRCQLPLRNKTANSVTISGIVKSCGCSEASIDRHEIAPDYSAVLTIVIDTHGRSGTLSVSVSVLGGKKEDLILPIVISGVVQRASILVADPERVDFGTVIVGQERSANIEVIRKAQLDTEVPRFETDQWIGSGGTTAQVLRQIERMNVDESGITMVSTLTVTLPCALQVGMFTDRVMMSANAGGKPIEVAVSVVAIISDGLHLSANSAFFDLMSVGTSATRRVSCHSDSGLSIIRVESDTDWCTAKIVSDELEPATQWIDVSVSPQRKGLHETTLRIIADDRNRAFPVTVFAQ